MRRPKNFDPVMFDLPRQLPNWAKDARMKYIALPENTMMFCHVRLQKHDFKYCKGHSLCQRPMKELAKVKPVIELGAWIWIYIRTNQDWDLSGGNWRSQCQKKGKEVDFDYYFKNKCLPQFKEIVLRKSWGYCHWLV